MSAALKRLRRRDGLQDEYMSSLRASHRLSGGTVVPRTLSSAITKSRALHQSQMPDVYGYDHEFVIDLGGVWSTIGYALWWSILLERRRK
jgi:hypothetical protein